MSTVIFRRIHCILRNGLGFYACLLLALSVHAESNEPTESVDGPKVEWDLSLWGTSRPGTRIVEALSEALTRYTGGNWILNVHYGEALSKARENLDGISIGAFEAAMVCNFYHPRKNPALMVLSLPFLPIDDWDDSVAVRKAVYANEQVQKEMARWGAMIYSSAFLPNYEVMGRGKPPESLEDWKGMTVRAGGGIGQVLAKLGATPTSTTATEVYTGIQQGTMDAATFPFTYGHVSYRIHEVAEWFTSNLALGTADCPIVFSIAAHRKLPEQYRDLLTRIEEEIQEEQRVAYAEIDRRNFPMLQEELTEVTYSPDAIEEFRARFARPVIEEWIEANEEDFDARALVEAVFSATGNTYD